MTKLKYFFIALVLAVSAFTHLYRIDKTFVFHNDEGRDALVAYRMIDTGKPVILGPETSVGNMYLGPFYYYLMVPPLILSKLDPVGPAIMVAFFGILTTLGLIYLGHKWGSTWGGIVSGLFYALSPVMLHYSRSSWNPNVIPFFATLLLLNSQRKSKWEPFWFGILTGIMFQLHYVALILPGLLFLSAVWGHFKSKQLKQIPRYILAALIGFLLASSPFWLFEARHNFVDTRAFGTYLAEKSVGRDTNYPSYLSRLGKNTETVISGIIASKSVSGYNLNRTWLIVAGAILFIYSLFNFKKQGYLLIGSLLIVSLLKESVYVHYLAFLFPIVSLIIGFATTKGKWLSIFTIIFLATLVKPTYAALVYNLHDIASIQTVRAKNVADYIVQQAGGRPYNVVNTQGSYTTTISYYLAISSHPPSNDLQTLVYDICENGPCPQDDESTVLLFLTGPAHPAIADYLGHPQINQFNGPRTMVKNEWVTYDIYVATIELKP